MRVGTDVIELLSANVDSLSNNVGLEAWTLSVNTVPRRPMLSGLWDYIIGLLQICAETSFVKKGNDSAGVARHYWEPLGKVDNCQVGVLAGYASRSGYALVDQRLCLPELWLSEAYAARRRKCQVPNELTFQSKPQLASAMLKAIVDAGLLPYKYIVADRLYGNSPGFLDAVDACVGVTALVAIPGETRCWRLRPQSEDKRIDTRDKSAQSG
jgi:SRSO17 transposase